jgi:glycosyltransferase involved in cell wall biosynthesis
MTLPVSATVDIVIPAYNAARWLPEALRSVLAQTFQDWHIVLVDDGSTDDTMKIAQAMQEQLGQRMTCIRQANAGVSAARNRAIEASRAPFIAFLDADDLWETDRLAAAMASFTSMPQAGLSYGLNTMFRSSDGVVVRTFAGNGRYGGKNIARYLYMRMAEIPLVTVTVRRACLEQTGLFDETMRATEDRDLWLRFAQRFPVVFVPQVVGNYRLSEASASGDPAFMLRGQRSFIEKHYGEPGCGWWMRRAALSRVYKQQAEIAAGAGRHGAALAFAFRAVVWAPWQIDALRTAASLLLRATASRLRAKG